MITGVPTVELHTKNSKSFYSTDHLNLADFIIESFDDLVAKVEEVLVNNTFIRDRIKKNQLNIYTEKYLYKVDGNRCSEYASKIDSFISHSTLIKDEINFIKKAQLLLKYSYLIGRKPVSVIKQRLTQLINGKDKIIKENNIDSFLDHLGRYDNRIKLGDEEFWFKKFKNLNIA